MNTYFPNPFLTSLQGEPQTPNNGLACNFGGLSGRYDQSGGQGYLCGNGSMPGPYGSTSPGHQAGPNGAVEAPNHCGRGPADINGYGDGQTHLNSPHNWGLQASQQSPTDFTQTTTTCGDHSPLNSSATPTFNTGTQSIPFYPWMGVVGWYTSFLHYFYCLVGKKLVAITSK